MVDGTKRPSLTGEIVIYAILGLWCIAMLAGWIRYIEQPWATSCLGAALISMAVTCLGAVLRAPLAAVYGVLLATSAALIARGLLTETGLEFGVLALIVVGASAPIAFALQDAARGHGLAAGAAASGETDEILRRVYENTMLSDSAKRVLFRERELGLLRDAIERDISEGKYNSSLTLCEEMAGVFGYVDEAEGFRSRILQARQERYDLEAHAALQRFDGLLTDRNWAMVHQEAASIRRLYGDSHLIQGLEARIIQAREEHKAELEGAFLQAAGRDDVEGAMAFLKELDRYLSRDEAERLTEVAQGVVVKHRANLGVQFKLAVNDRRWAEAAKIGEEIVGEFPNSKMADEVRSMIDVLRTRATQVALTGGDVT